MKRIHIHITADDLNQAKAFYAALFAQNPSVEKSDYLKWSLEDPNVNFAVTYTKPGKAPGIDHIGIQTDEEAELDQLQTRLADAQFATTPEPEVQCCYAHSNKHWANDPSGVVWEMFQTMAQAETYGDYDAQPNMLDGNIEACC